MIELNYYARYLPLRISDEVFILPARIRHLVRYAKQTPGDQ